VADVPRDEETEAERLPRCTQLMLVVEGPNAHVACSPYECDCVSCLCLRTHVTLLPLCAQNTCDSVPLHSFSLASSASLLFTLSSHPKDHLYYSLQKCTDKLYDLTAKLNQIAWIPLLRVNLFWSFFPVVTNSIFDFKLCRL
jgi:hypothetical protein